jgi:DNA mismatch repair ATPase MutS
VYLLGSFGLLPVTQATLDLAGRYFVTVAAACFAIHWTAGRSIEPVLAQVYTAGHDLGQIAELLERLERERFASPRLRAVAEAWSADAVAPSARIQYLRRLVRLLEFRRNELMRIAGPLLLWDVHLAHAIEDWRSESGQSIRRWLMAIAECEALASLGAYRYEHPEDVFPEVTSQSPAAPLFDAANLRHPLLPRDKAVANDVRLDDTVQALVVSGSNMSGKSTLLRTIGVNAVLAQAGAPVCATRLQMSPLVVGASIRVQDSLQDGTSRFYAEITRLSAIMARARGPVPVLFLIDEFLHGTNSHDRLIGAEAVVRGLLDRGAIGLITTHDLALSRLVETLGGRAVNVHFQDYLENGRMRFDYRMRPGVVQHSNAIALMRSVGLKV